VVQFDVVEAQASECDASYIPLGRTINVKGAFNPDFIFDWLR
jgi:hypothetical protein